MWAQRNPNEACGVSDRMIDHSPAEQAKKQRAKGPEKPSAAAAVEAMPAGGTRMAGLWEREVGRLPPKRFAHAVMASKDFVHALGIQKRLRKHRGCVNTISFNSNGSLLLSGSDDQFVVLWNWEEAAPTLAFHTGHDNNVLHAQFMPFSDDQSIITAGADGEVRHSQIQEGGNVLTDKIVELEYAVHKLAVEPGNPHMFFSCGEDGSVWHFDLRGKDATELFKCGAVDDPAIDTIELYAIAVDPRNPYYFALSGSDEYARLYDTRKNYLNGDSSFGCPVEYFCPPHLIGKNKDGITGLAFSQKSELLASYSYDHIYLFEREHGLSYNDFEIGGRLLTDQTVGCCHTSAAPLPFCTEKLPVPHTYIGHGNSQTIKGASFLGPNCDYVTSGSDCGNIFIWRKKDTEPIRAMKGDSRVVNCVEQHPSEIVVASSGIDEDIKIWAPGESEDPSIACIVEVDPEVYLFSNLESDDSYMDDYMFSSGYGSSDDDDDDDDDDDEDEDEEDERGEGEGEGDEDEDEKDDEGDSKDMNDD